MPKPTDDSEDENYYPNGTEEEGDGQGSKAQSLIDGDPQDGEDGQQQTAPASSPLHPAYKAPAQQPAAQSLPGVAPTPTTATSGLKPGVSAKSDIADLNNSPILADEQQAASLASLHPASVASPSGPVTPTGGYDADLKPIVPGQPAQPNPELAGLDPKEINSKRIAQYKTEGVQYYTDPETKLATPVTNQDGSVRFRAKTGPIEYDANGKAIQIQQDERGNRTPVYPDANAEIGAHPDTPNDLYRQNKQSAWEYLGKAHELVDSTDPKIAEAAQAATLKSEQAIHKAGSQAFGKQVFDSNQAIQAKTAEIRNGNQKFADISKQLDATLNDPKFNEKQTVQGAGVFGQIGGTDSLHTAAAAQLQARAVGLQGQLAELQDKGISGDVNADLSNKETFGRRRIARRSKRVLDGRQGNHRALETSTALPRPAGIRLSLRVETRAKTQFCRQSARSARNLGCRMPMTTPRRSTQRTFRPRRTRPPSRAILITRH
jgi:hypothetical protein